jgi:CubicO group peptidase (beta-lactamase class C family)
MKVSTFSRSRFVKVGQIFFVLLVLAVISLGITAQPAPAAKPEPAGTSSVPTAKPEDVGFSSERLAKIHDVMQKHIDKGEIAGVVLMISRNGKVVYNEAQGYSNLDTKKPMAKDNMFGLASGSKIIVATAIMTLVEDGKIHLEDPLSMYIPEFKNEKVRVIAPELLGRTTPAPKVPEPTVPAYREITIRDLLTHTSGMMGFGAPPSPIQPDSKDILHISLKDFMGLFAKTPLEFQPGTRWAYSNWAGFDILGRVVEVITGKPYPEYVKERIFDPIGMKDIGWGIVPGGDDPRGVRVAQRYQADRDGKLNAYNSVWSTSYKTYISACCGATTTAEDYWKFSQMLANEGEFNGHRILSPLSVQLMRTNHVGNLYANAGPQTVMPTNETITVGGAQYAPAGPERGNPGFGFGFGLTIVMDRGVADTLLPNGSYGFAGASGCRLSVSPKENIVLTFMVNGGRFAYATKDFETLAMQALVKE